MKNIFLLILMIGIIYFVPSCANPCKDPWWYRWPIANQLKKYSFEPGSYWIYQDSASGTIDSQSVYYYSAQSHTVIGDDYSGNGGWCNEYGDVFKMSIASVWNGIPHDSITFNIVNGGGGPQISVSYSPPNTLYSVYSYSALQGQMVDTLTNFYVLGQTFAKVYRELSYYNSLMYHVDNVGVIKWVFNDTINGQHTWNLLRYHVINP
jgi:hypothetical protein